MKKKLILSIVALILLIIVISIDFYMQRRSLKIEKEIKFEVKSIKTIDISNLIKINYNDNDVINNLGNWELWRYMKPQEKNNTQKKEVKKYINYQLKKRGNREIIVNPSNRNEVWEFYGVFIISKRPYAIFYNPVKKNYTIVTTGDKLNKDLTIYKITSSKIIIKFPISEKEYNELELKVFYVDINQFKKKLEREQKK